MAAEDYFYGYDEPEDGPQRTVTCRRCGKRGCHWENDDGQWNLYESETRLHRCNMQKAALDDFEVVK